MNNTDLRDASASKKVKNHRLTLHRCVLVGTGFVRWLPSLTLPTRERRINISIIIVVVKENVCRWLAWIFLVNKAGSKTIVGKILAIELFVVPSKLNKSLSLIKIPTFP